MRILKYLNEDKHNIQWSAAASRGRIALEAKVFVIAAYLAIVASFGKYSLSALMPFFIYPLSFMIFSDISLKKISRELLLVSPFALMIGIWNPLFDRNEFCRIGTLSVIGGWISFASIILRFVLSAGTVLVFLSITEFTNICAALRSFKIPDAFIVQMLFLYRYIFILSEETGKMERARAARSFGKKHADIKTYSRIVSSLLLRSLTRAQRVFTAMKSRGFNGKIYFLRQSQWTLNDGIYTAGWISFFIFLRVSNPVILAGEFLIKVFS